MDAVFQFMRVVRARYDTPAAGYAPVRKIAELPGGMLSLRVMASETAQRASFEEDCRADARSVVEGETLYVENEFRRRHGRNFPSI